MPVLRNNLESLYIPFLFFPPVKALRACPLPEHITQRRIKKDYRMGMNSQMLISWSMPLGYKYYLHNQLFTPFSADSEIATKSTAYQMVSVVPWPNYSITMNSYLLFCTANSRGVKILTYKDILECAGKTAVIGPGQNITCTYLQLHICTHTHSFWDTG